MNEKLEVLYVDDEADIRTIVEMSLGLDAGLGLRLCDTGKGALDLLDEGEWRPNIALIDRMMPEMSGEALLKALRAREDMAGLPILFVTASARQGDIQTYLAMGADGVITKPFDPLSLAAQVRDHYRRIKGA